MARVVLSRLLVIQLSQFLVNKVQKEQNLIKDKVHALFDIIADHLKFFSRKLLPQFFSYRETALNLIIK